MGDVVRGKYQISIAPWLWNTDRDKILEFAFPNHMTDTVLSYIPTTPELDYGLIIRPFTNNAWTCIGIFLIIGLAFFFLPYFFIRSWDDMSSNTMIKLSLWFFFVLIQAYYGGALTMFFANEIDPPFNNLREVLQAFPKWNLVFISGMESHFKFPADQVY